MSNKISATPSLISVTATAADTEYSLTVPAGTTQVSLFTNHASAAIRLAYETGKVAGPTEPYVNIASDKELYNDDVYIGKAQTWYVVIRPIKRHTCSCLCWTSGLRVQVVTAYTCSPCLDSVNS